MDFILYLNAVRKHRWALMSCAIFTGLGTYILYANKSNAWGVRATFVAAAFCLLVATFLAWRDEHKAVISAQPDFAVIVEHLRYEYRPDLDKTVFIFSVGIVNRGASSITSGWRGTYEFAGTSVSLNLLYLIDKYVIRLGSESVTLVSENQITAKTVDRRVETGEGKQGRIFFTLPGDHVEELRSLQFKAEISFCDFRGKTYRAVYVPSPVPVTSVGMYAGEHAEIDKSVVNSPTATLEIGEKAKETA